MGRLDVGHLFFLPPAEIHPILISKGMTRTILVCALQPPLPMLLAIMVHLSTRHTSTGLADTAIDVFGGSPRKSITSGRLLRPWVVVDDSP